jgi:hypothetical protein
MISDSVLCPTTWKHATEGMCTLLHASLQKLAGRISFALTVLVARLRLLFDVVLNLIIAHDMSLY